MPADLEKHLGHPLGQTSPAELQDLRSIYQTIKDGEAKWSDYIASPGEESADAAAAKGKLQALKARMKEHTPEPETLPVEREPGEEG